jgi:hypothetical protein
MLTAMIMEALSTSETLVNFETIWRSIPEDSHLYLWQCFSTDVCWLLVLKYMSVQFILVKLWENHCDLFSPVLSYHSVLLPLQY